MNEFALHSVDPASDPVPLPVGQTNWRGLPKPVNRGRGALPRVPTAIDTGYGNCKGNGNRATSLARMHADAGVAALVLGWKQALLRSDCSGEYCKHQRASMNWLVKCTKAADWLH